MPAIVLVMRKKEGCNKMSKKTHFVTAPFLYKLSTIYINSATKDPRPGTGRDSSQQLAVSGWQKEPPFAGHRQQTSRFVEPALYTKISNPSAATAGVLRDESLAGPSDARRMEGGVAGLR